jgi:NAD+ kinase
MKKPSTITLITHQYPEQTADAVRWVIDHACHAGIEVRLPREEVKKHVLGEREGCVMGADPDGPTDLVLVLGGDGTILTALRAFAGRRAPVFAINYGAIGFLSTVDHGQLGEGVKRALAGDFELLEMPALAIEVDGERRIGVNDISFHRRPHSRVAELEYLVQGEQLGHVRCDGLVASTPVGSTGYNLANGGPVMAWGVEGFAVSFISPHSLTARALVVSPDDLLSVHNRSRDPVDISLDGQPAGSICPDEAITASFLREAADLAQVPGSSFYRRLRDKFGRLAR